MSLSGTFLIISILYMSMSYYFYLWAKKYNKIGQIMKLWPLGFFFICCSAYFLSFISYPQFHFRQILSISLVFLWSLIIFIQINRRLKRKQEMQKEQERGSIARFIDSFRKEGLSLLDFFASRKEALGLLGFCRGEYP